MTDVPAAGVARGVLSDTLPELTEREVHRALHRSGWYITRQGGRHTIFAHPTRPGIVPGPRHRKALKEGTVRSIVKGMGLTVEEFKALLQGDLCAALQHRPHPRSGSGRVHRAGAGHTWLLYRGRHHRGMH